LGIAEVDPFFNGVMLQDIIRNDALFIELSKVLNPVGILVVDVRRGEQRDTIRIVVTVTTTDHRAGVEECTKAHRIIRPRLGIIEGDRDIDLEVSTPGLQRNFRDLYEFSLFAGQRCRIYDQRISAWVEGIIESEGDGEVVLSRAKVEDTTETIAEYHIPFSQIHKAKLAYAWEDM